ncbi:MAG: hypothetical protein HFG00_03045 [Oscillibacter sp.]|nr:hypothetical protein [Oscillibacter sp.]
MYEYRGLEIPQNAAGYTEKAVQGLKFLSIPPAGPLRQAFSFEKGITGPAAA